MTDKDWTLVPLEPTVVQVNAGVDSDDMRTGFETVKHIYRTMVRASPVAPSSGWRPIETAPRDGTDILVYPATAKFLVTGSDGLRHARKVAAEILAEMAADPLTRRSQDPYTRGQRDALKELDRRLVKILKDAAQ